MLTRVARKCYFDELQSSIVSLEGLVICMRERFKMVERAREILREWKSVSLASVMAQNKMKTGRECFKMLVKKLTDLQVSLEKSIEAK